MTGTFLIDFSEGKLKLTRRTTLEDWNRSKKSHFETFVQCYLHGTKAKQVSSSCRSLHSLTRAGSKMRADFSNMGQECTIKACAHCKPRRVAPLAFRGLQCPKLSRRIVGATGTGAGYRRSLPLYRAGGRPRFATAAPPGAQERIKGSLQKTENKAR